MHLDANMFNIAWLNRTANKTPRRPGQTFDCIVWHETDSPNPSNTPATLNYMLDYAGGTRGSYNYVVGQDGTVYHYVDERTHVAWHAGESVMVIDKIATYGFSNNVRALSISVDSSLRKNIPATKKQIDTCVALLLYLRKAYTISLASERNQDHKRIAPTRRKDVYSFSVERDVLVPARAIVAAENNPPLPPGTVAVHAKIQNAWELSGGVWQKNRLTPGYAKDEGVTSADGSVTQTFERGIAQWNEATKQVTWKLLKEM